LRGAPDLYAGSKKPFREGWKGQGPAHIREDKRYPFQPILRMGRRIREAAKMGAVLIMGRI
jgi:hypothetical protein